MKLKENKIFRWTIIPLCILLMFFTRFIPAPDGMTQDAMGVIGIFVGSIILWLTIGIDWPSLLCIFALGLLENLKFTDVLSSSFGNETFLFLLFTFICTYAISKTPLIKRIAIWFVSNKLAKKSGWWLSIMFLTSVLILGLFISPSVLFVILLPILNQIFEIAKIEKGEKIGKMLMMGLAFTVSISSGMTPIAHVFPILALNAANVQVSYGIYMLFAIPVGLIVFGLMLLSFRFILKPDTTKLNNIDLSQMKNELPKVNKEEIISLCVFLFVILLWVGISLTQNFANEFYTNYLKQYANALPPILGTLILCIVRVDKKPLLKIDDAFKNGVPWSSLVMCAGTLALSSALTNKSIGIQTVLENSLQTALAGVPAILLLIIFVVWATVQTNVSSNMVTAQLVSSVAAIVLASSTLSIPAVASIIGMLSAFAFATPPSMPHIAIAIGSDYANTKDMLLYGGILMLIAIIISCVVGYPLASLVM
ncbi:MAG: anion permease [Clostridiales bacterium]|nr:anion permease [Candidatus Apopatousia equi]